MIASGVEKITKTLPQNAKLQEETFGTKNVNFFKEIV